MAVDTGGGTGDGLEQLSQAAGTGDGHGRLRCPSARAEEGVRRHSAARTARGRTPITRPEGRSPSALPEGGANGGGAEGDRGKGRLVSKAVACSSRGRGSLQQPLPEGPARGSHWAGGAACSAERGSAAQGQQVPAPPH